MTLETRQGNAFDTASLLIALLRAAGIHASYVTGTIELPIDKVMNWAGDFTDSLAALDFISSGGIPTKGLLAGGKIVAARMEHVWVEAFIDYIPSRGAKHVEGQGDTWISLDPSYKQYDYAQAIDIEKSVPFDAQTFLDQINAVATVNETDGYVTGVDSLLVQQTMQDYQARVQSFIEENHPDATVGEVLGKKEILKQEFPILLGTLPYRTAVKGATFAAVPDTLRHKLSFEVKTEAVNVSFFDPDAPPETDNSLKLARSLPELAGRKITLSYAPATPQDELIIEAYLPQPHADGTPIQPSELPSSLPAYLINVAPELRIDGQVVATGAPVGLGGTDIFSMTFYDPSYGSNIITNNINAGSFHAIGINVSKISNDQIANLKSQLDATKGKLQDPNNRELSKEEYIGDLLNATAISYHSILELSRLTLARKLSVNYITLPSENIFSYPLDVRLFWGLPFSVRHTGINMDADSLLSVVQAKDGNRDTARQYMISNGMASSAMEHSVPEHFFSTPGKSTEGLSAVKALKIANDQGIPIYTLNRSNIANALPQLQIGPKVKNEIQNAVNTGKVVTVSKTNINYKNWTGCGYIITDPETGSGAYMISGGLAGFFAILGSYFTAIVDVISKDKVKGFVNVKPSPTLEIFAKIGAALTVVGFIATVYDIVANPKLSELQKILDILVYFGAAFAMLKVGFLIAGALSLLPAMLLAILTYFTITVATLLLIDTINTNFGYSRYRASTIR